MGYYLSQQFGHVTQKVLKQDENLWKGKKYAKFYHYGNTMCEDKEYNIGLLYVQTHFDKVEDVSEQRTFH